ncbi:hypothetical protein CRE_10981 [Caenorhabditis remanei]|uniref:Uncharacterized protein n=1 Tax=Caenorhabditis remanei TaxID=31234 RepID=E3M5U6_CAERE|nr:hypothetical protein CRE_10981 [Caenorhabditis remanei]
MSDDAKKKQMMQNFLNRKRKLDLKVEEEKEDDQKPSTSSEKKEVEEIEKKKKEEEKYDKLPSQVHSETQKNILKNSPRGVHDEPRWSVNSMQLPCSPLEQEGFAKLSVKFFYFQAKKALLFEAKRAKERAEQVGPQGYLKPKSLGTNKEFLRRTIESTMPRRKKNDE